MNVYTDLEILPNKDLKISITADGREELAEMDARENNPGTDYKLARLLEYHLGNGWEFVRPEEVSALTSSPILSNDVSRDDDGELTAIGEVWWFPNYQVINEVEEMKDSGFVIFTAGSNS